MQILAIETSCDDTAVAIVNAKGISDNQVDFSVLGNVRHSQIEQHVEFGGVYPNVARREHAANLIPLLEVAFKESGSDHKSTFDLARDKQISNPKEPKQVSDWIKREPELSEEVIKFARKYESIARENIDAIAVTAGPGLAPALWIGVNVARSLAYLWDMPLIATNHMAGHALSGLWPNHELKTPAMALLVSGGHTEINLAESPTKFTKIGHTIDDAAGEAFDKIARMIDIDYPGGPEISRLAATHRKDQHNYEFKYNLPLPMQHSGDYQFSFSGLKTAAKRVIESQDTLTDEFKLAFSREVEETIIAIIIYKLDKAITEHQPIQLLTGGGVLANSWLRQNLNALADKHNVQLLLPQHELTTDNALMIAMAGYYKVASNEYIDPKDITVISNWSL